MPCTKSAEQATFESMQPSPFYSLGQSKYMCTRILQTQLKLDQNVVENKLIKRDNLWIKSYIRFIKIKSHFSGTHVDDKFHTFEVACCITVSAPNFSHGSASRNSPLKSYQEFLYGVKTVKRDMLTINTTALYGLPFVNVHFQPLSQLQRF